MAAGELNAGVARAVVRACRQTLGRGPTKAHAFFRMNIVVVVLEETQTDAERSLVAAGRGRMVLEMHEALQQTMRADLVSAVETLTGREVTAFLSAAHINPDVATVIFILDGQVETATD